MRLWKKRPVDETQKYHVPEPTLSGDPMLPGIAGYQGVEPLPKGAMPERRFKFVRPDGKREP
jgi:hypothetical protein